MRDVTSLSETLTSLGDEHSTESILEGAIAALEASRDRYSDEERAALERGCHATCPFDDPLSDVVELEGVEGLAVASLQASIATRVCTECANGRHRSVRGDTIGMPLAGWVSVPCKGFGLDGRIRRHNTAGLPAGDLLGASFETWDQFGAESDETVFRIAKWASSVMAGKRSARGTCGLWLFGGLGAGKSHVMSAIVRRLTLERGQSARWLSLSRLLRELRALYSGERRGEATSEDAMLRPYIEAPFLAADDIGKRLTKHEARIFSAIIEERYERSDVTTIITSNYSPRGLADAIAGNAAIGMLDRTISRLQSMCKVAHLTGDDYRAAGAF